MNIAEYIEFTNSTAVYPPEQRETYLQLGLLSELGEVAALLKREIRDGVPVDRAKLVDEAGDVVWYLAQLVQTPDDWSYWEEVIPSGDLMRVAYWIARGRFGYEWKALAPDAFAGFLRKNSISLDEVISANVTKLSSRKDRGVLKGQGGER